MVDNPKNTPADDEPFDFGADWGGAGTSDGDFSPEDMDFGTGPAGSGGSDDDNPFASSGDDNPFAQGGEDDIFANASAFEEDDSFHSMPTPDNLSAEMEGEANPADDFGDLSADVSGESFGEPSTDGGFGGFNDFGNENDEPQSFASQDGFESGDDLFGADESEDAFATDDHGFGSPEENVYAEGEGFAPEEASAEEEIEQAAPVANSSGRGKGKLVIAGMAAAVLGIGYVGYTSVAPMFFGGADQPNPVVADAPHAPINQFPTALPGQDGGLPLPAPVAEDVGSPALPTVPAPIDVASPSLPSIPGAIQQEQDVADAGSPLAPVPALPGLGDEQEAPALALPEVGEASAPPLGLPSVPTPSSEDDLVSGDRGGITSMREQEDDTKSHPVSAETAAELKAVLERISSLEASVDAKIQSVSDDLNGRLSDLEAKLTSGSAVVRHPVASSEAPVSHTPVAAGSQPPLKPTIVENMSLKGVSRGMAWVKTDAGIIEARVGDSIGDVGRVLGITEYNGAWMVSTEKGLILQ